MEEKTLELIIYEAIQESYSTVVLRDNQDRITKRRLLYEETLKAIKSWIEEKLPNNKPEKGKFEPFKSNLAGYINAANIGYNQALADIKKALGIK